MAERMDGVWRPVESAMDTETPTRDYASSRSSLARLQVALTPGSLLCFTRHPALSHLTCTRPRMPECMAREEAYVNLTRLPFVHKQPSRHQEQAYIKLTRLPSFTNSPADTRNSWALILLSPDQGPGCPSAWPGSRRTLSSQDCLRSQTAQLTPGAAGP